MIEETKTPMNINLMMVPMFFPSKKIGSEFSMDGYQIKTSNDLTLPTLFDYKVLLCLINYEFEQNFDGGNKEIILPSLYRMAEHLGISQRQATTDIAIKNALGKWVDITIIFEKSFIHKTDGKSIKKTVQLNVLDSYCRSDDIKKGKTIKTTIRFAPTFKSVLLEKYRFMLPSTSIFKLHTALALRIYEYITPLFNNKMFVELPIGIEKARSRFGITYKIKPGAFKIKLEKALVEINDVFQTGYYLTTTKDMYGKIIYVFHY